MTSDRSEPDPLAGAHLLEQARALAFPRAAGTPGDERSIALVRDAFDAAGLVVEVEEISYDLRPAWRALRAVLAAAGLLLLASGWLLPGRPALAALLLAAALLAGATPLAWAGWAERLYRREGERRTANIVGRRRARGTPRLLLVLLAHHDSKSQSLTLPWRLGATLLAIGAALVLAGLVAAALRGVWAPDAARAAATLGAGALWLLATLRNGNDSPGGVDNAGSLAILLALARVLPPRVPDDVELVFLSTGAEEDHMLGALRWLDRHRALLARQPVLAINLDGAGNPGRAVLLERYGFGRRFSPALSALAREAAAALAIPVRGVLMPPAVGIDTIPFAHRGIESITLSSGSLNRATLAVHSARDIAGHLSAETLERIAALALETAVRAARSTPAVTLRPARLPAR